MDIASHTSVDCDVMTPAATDVLTDTIRVILADHGRLLVDAATLSPDTDLYGAGLTSHASVTLMLAVEDQWDVEFPAHLLRKSTFSSIGAIEAALRELGVEA